MRIIVAEVRDKVPTGWIVTRFQTEEEWKRAFRKWGGVLILEPSMNLPGMDVYKFVIPVGGESVRHFAVLIANESQ